MDYIMENNIYSYEESRIIQQESLESYINKCIVIAEGIDVDNKLQVITEEEAKKKVNIFVKFGEFIKKIFIKFIDALTRFTKNNEKWLKKYKDVILKNPFKYESVTMYNYPAGIKRMVEGAVPAFDNYDNIKSNLESRKLAYEWVAKSINYTNYTYKEDIEFSEDVTNFFRGGPKEMEFPAATINMTDIYNYCIDYQKMKTTVEKDRDTLENAISNITKEIEKKQSQIDTAKRTAEAEKNEVPKPDVSGKPPENNGVPTPSNSQLGNAPTSTVGTESAQISSNYISLIEMEIGKSTANNPKDGATAGYAGNTAGANVKNIDNGNKTEEDVAKSNSETIAKQTDSQELTKMTEACNNYITAARVVFTTKLSVMENCYKDYMKILIAHVDTYIGKKPDNNKTADAATNYNTDKKEGNDNNQQGQTGKK